MQVHPHGAINRAKLKGQNPNRNKQRRTTNQKGPRSNNNQNLYMVVPYHQGLSKRVKKTCSKYGVQVHFKGGQTIKKPPHGSQGQWSHQQQEWGHIQISMQWTRVWRRITLENLVEPLQKGSKSIKSPLHQYLTTVTPQVTISVSTNLL